MRVRWSATRPTTPLALTTSLAALVAVGCKVREPPPIESSFVDDFNRSKPGSNYNKTGRGYRVVNGALNAHGAHNHPLWLSKRLPPGDVQIEFDAWSTSPAGDIKVEVFGDGRSFDADGGAYKSSGYVLVFGAWKNSRSIIARQDEHGKEIVARRDPRVIPNQRYRWRIVRRQNVITWFIDDMDTPFLTYQDPQPLVGPEHQYFGFDNWETDTWFDNLLVKKL